MDFAGGFGRFCGRSAALKHVGSEKASIQRLSAFSVKSSFSSSNRRLSTSMSKVECRVVRCRRLVLLCPSFQSIVVRPTPQLKALPDTKETTTGSSASPAWYAFSASRTTVEGVSALSVILGYGSYSRTDSPLKRGSIT